jgi:hypothetical protein
MSHKRVACLELTRQRQSDAERIGHPARFPVREREVPRRLTSPRFSTAGTDLNSSVHVMIALGWPCLC